ncbi:MAG: SDR family oxidoreductase [Ilumatobacteraceae bacterium]
MNSSPKTPHEQTVVVCGATGYLGRHVVHALHADGWRVRALVRDASRLGDAAQHCDEVFVGHPTDPASIDGLFDGADAAFSSIGVRSFKRRPSFRDVDERANLNLVEAAERTGVGRFVFVSILRGDEFRDRSRLIEARERVVDRLRAGTMAATIIRPTGFFNDIGVLREMAARGRVWLIGDDQTRLNPIHGADLARVIADALATDDTTDRAVGGPDVMTQAELAVWAFEGTGKPVRVTRLPSRVVRTIGRLIEPVNPNAGANLQMFALMGEHDMVGDTVGTHHLADYVERPTRSQASGVQRSR